VAPEHETLRSGFLLDYHRYADGFFRCWNEVNGGLAATPEAFTFDLYASGEYSRILERQWGQDVEGGPQAS
jgi:hypothetical protein